jgi:hypothetical protein
MYEESRYPFYRGSNIRGDPENGFQTLSGVLHTIFRMVASRTFALSAPNHLLENQAGQVGGTLQRLMDHLIAQGVLTYDPATAHVEIAEPFKTQYPTILLSIVKGWVLCDEEVHAHFRPFIGSHTLDWTTLTTTLLQRYQRICDPGIVIQAVEKLLAPEALAKYGSMLDVFSLLIDCIQQKEWTMLNKEAFPTSQVLYTFKKILSAPLLDWINATLAAETSVHGLSCLDDVLRFGYGDGLVRGPRNLRKVLSALAAAFADAGQFLEFPERCLEPTSLK